MDTADRYVAQSVGIIERHVFICFHENFFNAYHTATYCPHPDIFLFVFINAFDGVYRDRTHIPGSVHDSGHIGRIIHIHDIDASAIGGDPEFIVYLHEVEDQVRGQSGISGVDSIQFFAVRSITDETFIIRGEIKSFLAVQVYGIQTGLNRIVGRGELVGDRIVFENAFVLGNQ